MKINLEINQILGLLVKPRHNNEASVKFVKRLMKRGVNLTITFRYSKEGSEYAWVESQTCEGVRVDLTEKLLMWLWLYCFSGKFEDIEYSDTDIEDLPINLEDPKSIQTQAFVCMLQAGKVKVRPAAKCPEGIIMGTYRGARGVMNFRIKSTPELMEIIENSLIIF